MLNFFKRKAQTPGGRIGSKTEPVRMQGYSRHGASFARKPLVAWGASPGDADADITQNLNVLRARSRDLYMGSPLATGALKTLRTNVVGSGLMLSPHIDRDALGLTEEQAQAWEDHVRREWLQWAGSTACDASRTLTFYQMQALAMMSALMSGDCFAALPDIPRPDSPYALKVYLIEGDRVCNPMDALASYAWASNTLEGVELGKYSEPVAYYVAKYHPNGVARFNSGSGGMQEWKRVPAFGARTGRRNMLHIMVDYERPAQRRGVPILAPVLEKMKQLQRYSEAELTAAVVAGYFTVFVKSENSAAGMPSISNPLAGMTAPGQADEEESLALGAGLVTSLPEGSDISTANPGRPNANYTAFVTAVCQEIAGALELPYELLMKQFTASYSASRAALLEAWKMFRMRREWLVGTFCQPVYETFLAEGVAKGRIEAPGFFDDHALRAAWCKSEWAGDTQGQLDPQKEAAAAILRVDNGFSTREREAAELTGMDIKTIAEQLNHEKELLKDVLKSSAPASPVQNPDNNGGEDEPEREPLDDESGNRDGDSGADA